MYKQLVLGNLRDPSSIFTITGIDKTKYRQIDVYTDYSNTIASLSGSEPILSNERIVSTINDPTDDALEFNINFAVSIINNELKWWQQIIQPIANFKKYIKYFN